MRFYSVAPSPVPPGRQTKALDCRLLSNWRNCTITYLPRTSTYLEYAPFACKVVRCSFHLLCRLNLHLVACIVLTNWSIWAYTQRLLYCLLKWTVHGMEYGFGAHEFPTSGVFEVEPKSCPGFVYRRSLWMGTTDMSRAEFRSFIENLAGKYNGNTYHLISKNCNHFTDDVCKNLTRKSIPGWVNRLAKVGWYHQFNLSLS